jgi:hypothetical protein
MMADNQTSDWTGEQVAAAANVRRALRKAATAGLSLRVYDGTVYVVPVDLLAENNFSVCLEYGEDVGGGISADGGAGA